MYFNRQPCIKLEDLWLALHSTFNLTQDQQINLCLDEIPTKPLTEWLLFSKAEFTDTIKKYSSSSTSGSNYLSWNHLEILILDKRCISNFINITNVCINLSFWLLHLYSSTCWGN